MSNKPNLRIIQCLQVQCIGITLNAVAHKIVEELDVHTNVDEDEWNLGYTHI